MLELLGYAIQIIALTLGGYVVLCLIGELAFDEARPDFHPSFWVGDVIVIALCIAGALIAQTYLIGWPA